MGQRLVIALRYNNEVVAACWYHWSAYTMSALQELSEMTFDEEAAKEVHDIPSAVDYALNCWEASQIGWDNWEDDETKRQAVGKDAPWIVAEKTTGKRYKQFEHEGDRSAGLIDVLDGADSMLGGAEGSIVIDIETLNCDFCVMNTYESIDEAINEYDVLSLDCATCFKRVILPDDLNIESFHISDLNKIIRVYETFGDDLFECRSVDSLYNVFQNIY